MATSDTLQACDHQLWYDATKFTQHTWDPTDYYTSGTSFSRTFELDADNWRGLDGFEVLGTIDVTYVVVPEPSTLVMLLGSAGVALLLSLRRRKRILA